MAYRPILCLDFDGVIHMYSSGWKGAAVIPDAPVPGALEFIIQASEKFSVNIFSSRSHQQGGIQAMKMWLDYWQVDRELRPDIRISEIVHFPTEKPPAHITLDDRAVTFNGTWPDLKNLLEFKPWNKK